MCELVLVTYVGIMVPREAKKNGSNFRFIFRKK